MATIAKRPVTLTATTPRYIVTRMIKDRRVPERYRRSGWMAFDTLHLRHGQVWPTKAEAQADATRFNSNR